jgi:hypothetical protein
LDGFFGASLGTLITEHTFGEVKLRPPLTLNGNHFDCFGGAISATQPTTDTGKKIKAGLTTILLRQIRFLAGIQFGCRLRKYVPKHSFKHSWNMRPLNQTKSPTSPRMELAEFLCCGFIAAYPTQNPIHTSFI